MPRGYYKRKVERPQIEQPLDASIRYIPLTKGLVAIVDAADFPTLTNLTWSADSDCDGRTYPATTLPRDGAERQRKVKMHRFLLGDSFECIDHINRNPLDNRRSNLRGCTAAENAFNRSHYKNNTSGAKGVTWIALTRRWRAEIRFRGKRRHLGYFRKLDDAARAYDEAAVLLMGEFAAPNEIQD